MNLTPLGQYSNAAFMYQPQLEAHDPNPPLFIGEVDTTDNATVYLRLSPYLTEEFPVVSFRLTPSYLENYERFDADTIYLVLDPSASTEYSQPLIPWWDPPPDAKNKWWVKEGNKWRGEATTRFTLSVRGRL